MSHRTKPQTRRQTAATVDQLLRMDQDREADRQQVLAAFTLLADALTRYVAAHTLTTVAGVHQPDPFAAECRGQAHTINLFREVLASLEDA